jgi:hypothetical protein
MGDIVPPSTVLAFVTKISEKVGSTTHSATYVEKLDVIRQLEKGKQIVDICHVRFAHRSIHTIHENV